jgi:hypothetical protein
MVLLQKSELICNLRRREYFVRVIGIAGGL